MIQTKLKIGQRGDKYEREADTVADRVMRMSEGESIRMQPLEEEEEMMQMQPVEEEEELQMMCENCRDQGMIQQQPIEEEEELLQPKPMQSSHPSEAPARIHSMIDTTRGSGSSIDRQTMSSMGNIFGTDFSNVNIHTDSAAMQMNRQLNAQAFTVGNDIYFNQNKFNPNSQSGKRLLAHELTHVVQQKAGKKLIQRNDLPAASPAPPVTPSTTATSSSGADAIPTTPGSRTPAAATSLTWHHIKRHRHDALWYFCGENPTGFSTNATLRAQGFSNPNNLEWFVRQGADKVYAPAGFNGSEITLHSSAGSRRRGDVHIEVKERMPDGTMNSHLGHFTVRKPHRLRQVGATDHANCPPAAGCPAACPAYWTEFNYRVIDNVGGTIVGATVNERFPNAKVNDNPNDWVSPAAFITTPFWANTNGTFIDNWFVFCGTPSPVATASPNALDLVDHMDHEFYVGSQTPGRGCRVQTHTAQRLRAFAEHNNIVTPAP